ncbi:MAG TPA: hypothetical protein VGN20_18710 [Mucilaginibacter sp.]|jgi:hypothetical protein
MKIKATTTAVCLLFFLLSCSKDNSTNIELNGALTDCPANTNCTYSYYNSADFTASNQLVKGSFRVFAFKSGNSNSCGPSVQLYFKTALNSTILDISAKQIAAGQVTAYNMICPCCEYFAAIYSKPIGGEIKGKRTDSNHWLINASIIFGNQSNTPIDTVTVNQYFTLEKLP